MKNILRISSLVIVLFSILACKPKQDLVVMDLNNNWSFKEGEKEKWLKAEVPGAVHADLQRVGIIEDPFFKMDEKKNFWVERTDWEYQTTFVPSAKVLKKNQIFLVFKGLDTYAHVYLNDELLLDAQNMFIEYRIDIKDKLKKGENTLRVYFDSPVRIGEKKLSMYDYILVASNELAPDSLRSNVVTRKAPFHYGWDWGPRIVTSGIWRPVSIEAWNEAKIEECYFKPLEISKEKASYTNLLKISAETSSTIDLSVFINGTASGTSQAVTLKKGSNEVQLNFSIDKPEFWWTRGLGKQPLYDISVVMSKEGKILQTYSDKIGVRTIELAQEQDSIGHSFKFILNGVPVFMKGANYIPNETVTTKVTPKVYNRVVQDAVDANMNMLRVWGGAIYENDIFYDLCDEKGILVWQDFMFACSVMPPDDEHLEEIRKEAIYNVKRLRNHPCMALWCGNNENLIAWFRWNWKEKNYTPEQAELLWKYYQKIYCETLPKAVSLHHPELEYWSSSPSSLPDETTENPACNIISDRKSGDEHDWSIWFGNQPFSNYKNNVPRFVSEYGLQSFPEMKNLETFADEEDMSINSEVMKHRQRSRMEWIEKGLDGNGMMKIYISKYYKEPKDFESFVYLSLVNQAEGLKMAVESHRKAMPYCMGSLYWQINDCWPTMSWSSVDYFGNWKASHYFLKKAFQPTIVVPSIDNNALSVYVVSDELESKAMELIFALYDFNGKEIKTEKLSIKAPENNSKKYFETKVNDYIGDYDTTAVVLKTSLLFENNIISDNYIYFAKVKSMHLPKPNITTDWENSAKNKIKLSTDKLAKNIYLSTDIDGQFSDNFFDLLPGESKEIHFYGRETLTKENLKIRTISDAQ